MLESSASAAPNSSSKFASLASSASRSTATLGRTPSAVLDALWPRYRVTLHRVHLGKGLPIVGRAPRAVAAFDEALGAVVALGLVRRLLLLADEENGGRARGSCGRRRGLPSRMMGTFTTKRPVAASISWQSPVLPLRRSSPSRSQHPMRNARCSSRALTWTRLDLERLQQLVMVPVYSLLERLLLAAAGVSARPIEPLCDRRRRVAGGVAPSARERPRAGRSPEPVAAHRPGSLALSPNVSAHADPHRLLRSTRRRPRPRRARPSPRRSLRQLLKSKIYALQDHRWTTRSTLIISPWRGRTRASSSERAPRAGGQSARADDWRLQRPRPADRRAGAHRRGTTSTRRSEARSSSSSRA